MAVQYVRLMDVVQLAVQATPLVASATSVYANPASTTTYVKEIELHNTTSSSVDVILCLVPNSSGSLGTPAATNQIARMTIVGYDTIYIEPASPYVLDRTNDSIMGVAQTSGINAVCRGIKDA